MSGVGLNRLRKTRGLQRLGVVNDGGILDDKNFKRMICTLIIEI